MEEMEEEQKFFHKYKGAIGDSRFNSVFCIENPERNAEACTRNLPWKPLGSDFLTGQILILTSSVAPNSDAIYRAIRRTVSLHNPKIQQERVKIRVKQQKLLRSPSKHLGTRFVNQISHLQGGGCVICNNS